MIMNEKQQILASKNSGYISDSFNFFQSIYDVFLGVYSSFFMVTFMVTFCFLWLRISI